MAVVYGIVGAAQRNRFTVEGCLMEIVNIEQGSEAWHRFRASHRMASESAALMRLSPWYPRTPFDLFQVKSGRAEVRVTPAMARGVDLEATARALYEVTRSDLMVPYVTKGEGDYAASLDGLSFHGTRILEVKCPFFGTRSKLWKQATAGKVPKHAAVQVQHQLMASGAELADFAVYAWDVHQLTIIEVRPDPAMQARIRAAWDAFWPDYLAGRAPPNATRGQAGEDYLGLLRKSIRLISCA